MLISKTEMTNQRLFEVYSAAFMQPEMDDDGDVQVEVDGLRLVARVSNQGFFVLMTGFCAKADSERIQLLELCNRVNDRMVMIRCSVPNRPEPSLFFDHMTVLNGGITGEEIVVATRRFASAIEDGLGEYDTEDIVT